MRAGFCVFSFLSLQIGIAQPVRYDYVFRNTLIVDGSGAAWFKGDVATRGDTIAAMGLLPPHTAGATIDVGGLALAPGFVDTHSHSRQAIFAVPSAENLIRQGVTTLIEGPDGSSPIPLKPFLAKLGATPIGVNFGSMAGHGSIRAAVMGSANRAATAAELARMRELMAQAMRDGAFGLSTGLFYVPGNYATTEEVIEIARVAGQMGGVHTSHMRDEAAAIMTSVAETIRIGEEGKLPTQLTHHKIIGGPNWGRSVETLRLVAEARASGVDVTVDQYPYTASSTGISALLPQWALSDGPAAIKERLSAPETRARIKTVIVDKIKTDRGAGDPKNIQIASCGWDASLAGKTLSDIAAERGLEASIENAADIAMEMVSKGGCSAIYHAIDERDVERIMRYPFTMIASDGGVVVFGAGVPHPRNYGTFARVLSRYVRERNTLTLEDAVRKMTSLPAGRFRVFDRGLLRPGMKADLVVFDPKRVRDAAEFGKPHQYAEGFVHVFVNGRPVLRDGRMTGERPGRVLLGPGSGR